MNKIAKIIALSVCAASALTLSACGGCGGTIDYKTNISPNWQLRASAADELYENADLMTRKEVATYSISFAKGTNSYYSAEYSSEGSYTTTLYAMAYDWNAEAIPSNLRIENTTDYVYVYETELVLPVTYTVGDRSETITNNVTTVSYFRSAANGLTPVYSRQEIKGASPNSMQPVILEDAYVEMNRVYETWYSRDCTLAVTDVSGEDGVGESSKSTGIASEYSVFDASSLQIALRGMTQSGAQSFDIYVPANNAAARYQTTWGSQTEISAEDESFSGVLTALGNAVSEGYLLTGTDSEGARKYSYVPVTVSLLSAMSGPSNTYCFATVKNTDMNADRAVMLRMVEVVPFSLGTITYNLSSIKLV